MAKFTYIFAQVFAASCLLAFLSTLNPVNADGTDIVDEYFQAWLESLDNIDQSASPDDEQEHQLPYNFTQEQQNYFNSLLTKIKQDGLTDDVKKPQEEQVLQDDSEEEQQEEQKVQEPDDNHDDSDEEETEYTTTQTTTTTTTQTTPTTTPPEPTTTTEETTTTTTPAPTTTTEETTTNTTITPAPTTTTEKTTSTTTTPATTTTTEETTTDIITPEPFCVGYKPYVDIAYYLQFNGVSWVKMSCPNGLGFDYNTCACSIRLERPNPTTTTTTITPETTTTTTTTQKLTTTVKPSLELCYDCVILHGVGYAPFPGYCDAYIQCGFFGELPTAISIRRCPSGYYWNQDKLTCDYEENVKCVPVNNCPNHKAITGDWAAYLIFNGQTWSRISCPSGTTYNSVTCGCTDKHDDNDDVSHEDCSDTKAIPGDKAGFLQLTGNGWVRMPCPATVGYNEQTCGCTDKLVADDSTENNCPDKKFIPGDKSGFLQFNGVTWIRRPCPATLAYDPYSCICTYDLTDDNDNSESKDDDLCKSTLTLTFDSNDATDSSVNQFWVNNTGVTFKDGKAYFNGKSRLTIPGLSNMEFGSTVYIIIKYKHTSASSQQTLVANGDCQVRQSLAVCSGKESVDFYAETKEQLSLAKITVPSDIGAWQFARYALEKDNLEGSVGTNRVIQPIKGALDRRQRGLVIGGGGNCDNFHGIIDEVRVYLCKPEL